MQSNIPRAAGADNGPPTRAGARHHPQVESGGGRDAAPAGTQPTPERRGAGELDGLGRIQLP
eukprot:6469277-Lingulodinium_polyedra.AAC.1